MASTAPSAVCGRCFPGLVWVMAGAMRSTNSLDTRIGVSAAVRQGLRSQCHPLLHRCRQRTSLRVVALGQRLRHLANRITTTVSAEHGERVWGWFQAKKAGWYTVLADPQMPAMSASVRVVSSKLVAVHVPIRRRCSQQSGCATAQALVAQGRSYCMASSTRGLCALLPHTAPWRMTICPAPPAAPYDSLSRCLLSSARGRRCSGGSS